MTLLQNRAEHINLGSECFTFLQNRAEHNNLGSEYIFFTTLTEYLQLADKLTLFNQLNIIKIDSKCNFIFLVQTQSFALKEKSY